MAHGCSPLFVVGSLLLRLRVCGVRGAFCGWHGGTKTQVPFGLSIGFNFRQGDDKKPGGFGGPRGLIQVVSLHSCPRLSRPSPLIFLALRLHAMSSPCQRSSPSDVFSIVVHCLQKCHVSACLAPSSRLTSSYIDGREGPYSQAAWRLGGPLRGLRLLMGENSLGVCGAEAFWMKKTKKDLTGDAGWGNIWAGGFSSRQPRDKWACNGFYRHIHSQEGRSSDVSRSAPYLEKAMEGKEKHSYGNRGPYGLFVCAGRP